MEFFETYYFVNIIFNVLTHESLDYMPRIHSWYENQEAELFLPPFSRWSVLHDFIAYVIEDVMVEDFDESHIEKWLNLAFNHHGISFESYKDWLVNEGKSKDSDNFYEYLTELKLTESYEKLLHSMVDEIFYILFGNRTLLMALHTITSAAVQSLTWSEIPEELVSFLKHEGVLKRVNIPEWAKRAVFFRDRGMCAQCQRDLSGIVNLESVENFDHIIPLALGGLNDVTNLQLLCRECNAKKGGAMLPASNFYQRWYNPE